MIWYALEIVLFLLWLLVCFLVYRVLVNSSQFTRFIEGTKGTDESMAEDIEIRVTEGKESAREVARRIRREIRRKGSAAERLDNL